MGTISKNFSYKEFEESETSERKGIANVINTTEIRDAVKAMLKKDTDNLSDEEALGVAALYPTWTSKIGQNLAVGERLWYDGSLYKVIQAHTAQDDWTPSEAVSLFTKVSISEYPD